MEEVENQSVNSEIAAPQTETHDVHNNEVEVQVARSEDRKDGKHWKAFREKQKQLERELEMQKEMNERLLQMTAHIAPKQQVVDELDSVSDEEFIPKGKQRKLVQKEVEPLQKELQELKKEIHQQRQVQFMDKLKRQYSDFDDVVNQETLSLLEEQDPELAQSIADNKDPQKMALQAYKYIKALNITEKVPQSRRAKEVDKKIENNAKTVQSPQAYDKRPLAQAYRMTDSEKSKLFEEMTSYARMAGSVPELT